MEACTAAQAKAVEVDGVCVDSRWQLKYLPWGLRDGLGAAGLGVIMTHPTECYYLKTVLGWNDIVMGWDFCHVFMALAALAQQLTFSFCVLFCLPYNCFFSAPCLFPCPSFSHSSLFFLVSAYMHYRDSFLCMHRFLAEYAEIWSITFFVLPLTLKKLMRVCIASVHLPRLLLNTWPVWLRSWLELYNNEIPFSSTQAQVLMFCVSYRKQNSDTFSTRSIYAKTSVFLFCSTL